jgi:hypothetical protein
MSTLLVIDPGICATNKTGDWLPDPALYKSWVNDNYGPVRRSLAYVTYQPQGRAGTHLDDGTDSKRDRYFNFLLKCGFTDVSKIYSTPAQGGTLKCVVDTSLVRDIWHAAVIQDTFFSPLTGYHSLPIKGFYDRVVIMTGDWDIVRPLTIRERVHGSQPTLLDLGIEVVVTYKTSMTSNEILVLHNRKDITFVPLEKHRDVLSRFPTDKITTTGILC